MQEVWRRRTIAVVSALMALAGGCSTEVRRNDPGTGYGLISVGSPRIEGRERLINERSEQERWLRERAEAIDKAPLTSSGAIELNSLAQTALQAGVSVDPAFKLNRLQQDRQADALRQSRDDERSLAGFRSSARDQIIAKFNKGELTAEQAKTQLADLGLTLAPAASAPEAVKPADAAASVAARPVTGVAFSDKPEASRPPASDPRTTSIVNSPLEDFQDRLAGRELLRNELNDIRLDDLHDLNGNTLYRLTFDTAVMPHQDASAWAMVEIRIPVFPEGTDFVDLKQRAEQQFKLSLRDTAERTFRVIANRLASECYAKATAPTAPATVERDVSSPDDDPRVKAFRRAFGCASYAVGSTTRRGFERLLSEWEPRCLGKACFRTRANLMVQLDEDDTGNTPAARTRRHTLGLWAEWLGELIERQMQAEFGQHMLACFDTLEILYSPSSTASARPVRPTGLFDVEIRKRSSWPRGQAQRCGTVKGSGDERWQELLLRNTAASVYAVTPKETVQRLSEVASNRKVNELLMNLSAVTGTAGVSAGLRSLRANDAFYHALRRQPLIVGMTEVGRVSLRDAGAHDQKPADELVFSWVLGPSFRLSDDGRIQHFRHSPAQRIVAAELSLPAWMDRLRINYRTYWLREDELAARTTPAAERSSHAGHFTLDLPAQPAEALAAIDDRYLREPQVDDFQIVRVTEGAEARVLISGRHLWRSTEVLIGAQRADQLTILPDNRGVIATFKQIQPPESTWRAGGKDAGVRLHVVTSEGRVHAGEVHITPKSAPTSASPASSASPAASAPLRGPAPPAKPASGARADVRPPKTQ